MSSFVRCLLIVGLGVALTGCPKKDEAAAAPDAGSSAVSSASATPTASVADTAQPTTPGGGTAAQTEGPPKGAPEVIDDPNAPPSHDDHDKAATTSIQKQNYKSELDKLEKEDLGN